MTAVNLDVSCGGGERGAFPAFPGGAVPSAVPGGAVPDRGLSGEGPYGFTGERLGEPAVIMN